MAGHLVLGVTMRITPGRMPLPDAGAVRTAHVSVNAHNYRVSLQGGFDDVMPEDSAGGAAGSPRAASPSPGPGPQGNMHVILHVTLM